jgi:hypothetical protein
MLSFVDMRRCELSIDRERRCSYMKDDREQEEKAGQHGGERQEQCAAMVTAKPIIDYWALGASRTAARRGSGLLGSRQCILRNMLTQTNA